MSDPRPPLAQMPVLPCRQWPRCCCCCLSQSHPSATKKGRKKNYENAAVLFFSLGRRRWCSTAGGAGGVGVMATTFSCRVQLPSQKMGRKWTSISCSRSSPQLLSSSTVDCSLVVIQRHQLLRCHFLVIRPEGGRQFQEEKKMGASTDFLNQQQTFQTLASCCLCSTLAARIGSKMSAAVVNFSALVAAADGQKRVGLQTPR